MRHVKPSRHRRKSGEDENQTRMDTARLMKAKQAHNLF
jgi:hypothetical protein